METAYQQMLKISDSSSEHNTGRKIICLVSKLNKKIKPLWVVVWWFFLFVLFVKLMFLNFFLVVVYSFKMGSDTIYCSLKDSSSAEQVDLRHNTSLPHV